MKIFSCYVNLSLSFFRPSSSVYIAPVNGAVTTFYLYGGGTVFCGLMKYFTACHFPEDFI